MLTHEGCLQRRRLLWQQIPDRFQWLLVGDPRHVQYLCNFRVNPISFSADQRPLLLLQRDGQTVLLADNFVRRCSAYEVFVDQEVIVAWYTHRKSVTNRDHALVSALKEVQSIWQAGSGLAESSLNFEQMARKRRGFNEGLLESEGVSHLVAATVSDHGEPVFEDQAGRAVTLGDTIRSLRRVKLDDEIALLRRCMTACDAGHAAAFHCVQPGVSELEIYLEVQRAAQLAAGMPCVVYGDFRANNATRPKAGGQPTEYRLQSGDLFILDFSVVIHGYRSDFTNTISVGEPTSAAVHQFEACRDALAAAARQLKAGTACRDVYEAASLTLQQQGFAPLAHHAGHGLGLEHPEPPILVPDSDETLVAGDVVTLEPGCYLEGVGGMRFEHNYLVTDTGSEQLSGHRIELCITP